jgi:hypothetical protein
VRLEFFPAAERELFEVAEAYEHKAHGLGNDFILEIERVASVLTELPSLGENSIRSIGEFRGAVSPAR